MIRTLVLGQAAKDPSGTALLAPGRTPLDYGALRDALTRTGERLGQLGIRSPDRVALVCANGPEMATAFLGIAAHAACAPLNPAYRAQEFEFYLADLHPAAVVVESGLDTAVRSVAAAQGIPLIELTPDLSRAAGTFELLGSPVERPPEAGEPGPDSIALLLHTSGTTSRPKLVPLTQANLSVSAANIARGLELTPADRCLNVMPLFHIHGLGAAVLASIAAGASVVCAPGFAAPKFFDWLDEFGPTWYTAVPAIHQSVIARAAVNRAILNRHRLRFIRSCSSALAPSLMEELEAAFGVPVLEAYGMTEAAHQMASNPLPPGRRKPGSVGRAAGPEVAIMDDEGSLLAPGTTGEAVIRGLNVTPGYADNPEANERSFTLGWFRTGDQGYLDGEGYLFLTGRLKEIINRGGEKIAPREIDEALLRHPAVAQAVAFAAPHRTLGESVAAAVVLRAGAAATAKELREFIAERLADFKVPEQIFFLDEIPKGPTGKIQRIGMAARLGLQEGGEPPPAGEQEEYVAPKTDTEKAVAALFASTLGLGKAGVRDNFFARGGDSLLTVTLLAAIRETRGMDLPVLDFLEDPTVSGVCRRIEALGAGPSENRAASLRIMVRPGQSRPALFAIPGSAGDVLGFFNLARLLDRQQPVTAFRLPPVDPGTGIYRIEDLAALFIEEVLEMQSEGPYHLAGECTGGLVAYEMAQQLRATGREVGMLALMDCFNQAWIRGLPSTTSLRYRFDLLGRRLANSSRNLVEAGLGGAIGYVRPRVAASWQLTREHAEERQHRRLLQKGLALPKALCNQRLAMRYAGAQYEPSSWTGRLVLLRAKEPRVEGYDYPEMGWQGMARDGIVIHDVPGSHAAMLSEPSVRVVAEVFGTYLERANAATRL